MLRLLQSGWMTILIGALCYFGVTVLLLDPAKIFTGGPIRTASGHGRIKGASWDFFDPEVDRLLESLNEQKTKLAERERQLDELARRLETERAEILQITQMVHQAQVEFDRTIVRVQQEEAPNLKRQAKTYSAMTPAAAAAVLSELEDDQMVRILVFMKEDALGPILEIMSKKGEAATKRVANISERLRKSLAKNSTPP